MNYKKTGLAVLTAILISFSGMGSAEASLWPGLAAKVSEKSGAFRTDDFHQGTITLRSPYLVTHAGNEDFAGRVNAAIAREKDRFIDELAADNAKKYTEGWMIWHEGLIGNFISNNEGITSIVLVEQKLTAGDEHGQTFAKGLNFNSAGDLFDLPQVLPRLTVADVNACIELTAKKKGITLLPDHQVTELPSNFYIGKNRVVYALYQQDDLTPFSEGVFSVPSGKCSIPDFVQRRNFYEMEKSAAVHGPSGSPFRRRFRRVDPGAGTCVPASHEPRLFHQRLAERNHEREHPRFPGSEPSETGPYQCGSGSGNEPLHEIH